MPDVEEPKPPRVSRAIVAAYTLTTICVVLYFLGLFLETVFGFSVFRQ